MDRAAGERRRAVRPGVYAIFFLLFAAATILSHLPLIRLPYYWDEAGQFIPAALDILREGSWIPHSTVPNVHPPAVMAYLAATWRLAGFHPAATRLAMLLLASFAMLASFLLAIELSREVEGRPAFLAAGLLFVSPLFFAQAGLAQLDAPAMLFTTLALLLFLQDRVMLSAAVTLALVMVKETGAVVPLVFMVWLASERRWREAAYFLGPLVLLGSWVLVLKMATRHWLGDPEFVRYNLLTPLQPVRVVVTMLRRLYYLFAADFRWLGTAALVYTWRTTRVFHSRAWRIAWLLVAAHVVMLSVLGGAVLERYLLPALPIVYAGMAAGMSLIGRVPQVVCSAALLVGSAACNFINPPYIFPYEDNLAFADFLRLQSDAADYLAVWHPGATVHTVWPLTAELSQPDLGFVRRALPVQSLPDLTPETFETLDWRRVQILVVYSRTWQPRFSLMRFLPVSRFWRQFYQYTPSIAREECRAKSPYPVEAHFERRGQWVDIYVNRSALPPSPYLLRP